MPCSSIPQYLELSEPLANTCQLYALISPADVYIRKYKSFRISTISNNIKTGRVKNGDGDELERGKNDRYDLPAGMNDYKRDNNNNNSNTARVVTSNYNENSTIYNNRNNNNNNNNDDINNNNNNNNKNDNYNNNNSNYNYNNNNSKINNFINNGMNKLSGRFMNFFDASINEQHSKCTGPSRKSLYNIVNNGPLKNFNDNHQGGFDTWEEKRHRRHHRRRRRHHPRFISQSIFIEDEKRRHFLKRNIYDSYRNQFDDLTKMHRNKPIKDSNNNKKNNNNRLKRLQNKPNNSLTNDDIDMKKNELTNSRRKIRQTENDLTAKPFRHQITCPKNLGLVSGQICGKSCKRDVDCRGNKRKCLCDGPCGMTCVKTSKSSWGHLCFSNVIS
ncbi:hypothetical protein HELRODRAFT_163749 [Helobdella robusta]|uniref:WAP domain-containing protein n=1 Tax=Helobdella robusta TaxID=6412 RepID=T1EUE9_HELRO|nr:hypothetical protein HELRODRAFT_163749 [Helobdella robusta]ESN96656.1 hypothetical protein HELRODRAFT_163749 [Helobdella robusta]